MRHETYRRAMRVSGDRSGCGHGWCLRIGTRVFVGPDRRAWRQLLRRRSWRRRCRLCCDHQSSRRTWRLRCHWQVRMLTIAGCTCACCVCHTGRLVCRVACGQRAARHVGLNGGPGTWQAACLVEAALGRSGLAAVVTLSCRWQAWWEAKAGRETVQLQNVLDLELEYIPH